jgi:hypothetical protein
VSKFRTTRQSSLQGGRRSRDGRSRFDLRTARSCLKLGTEDRRDIRRFSQMGRVLTAARRTRRGKERSMVVPTVKAQGVDSQRWAFQAIASHRRVACGPLPAMALPPDSFLKQKAGADRSGTGFSVRLGRIRRARARRLSRPYGASGTHTRRCRSGAGARRRLGRARARRLGRHHHRL